MEVIAQKRDVQGKGASRRLRRSGKTPGVLYGGNKPAVSIELDHNMLFHALKREAFHASVLTLVLDGAKESVLLRDFVMHPFRSEVQHIDFQRVDSTHKLHISVPLHFVNADIAPGVKLSGGNVSHVMTELEISCLPGSLPEFIEVDLGQMAAGHSLHVADIKLPAGVESVATLKGENPVVATIVLPRGAQAEEAAG
ncbi:MAG: 50S ribosomal protein L25/general stress protein Ctc [Betaproteobacteria bacterium]|nr:50S ribosomal protein L25/general stress protein Ctc [Betaproteobacteria bacterium]